MAADKTKLTTLGQAEDLVNAALLKVKNKGYALNSSLGDLASKNEVAESDLASELATKINSKADAGTSLSDYGIADAYTKTETDNKIAEVQATAAKPGGSLDADEVLSSLLVVGNEGKVYNLNEDFTTTSDFVDGAGKPLPAGSNIWIINTAAAGETAVYKFDTYAAGYGVATPSGNGLMSATDKEKLDNADVTAYTAGNGVQINSHSVSAKVVEANGLSVDGSGIAMAAAESAATTYVAATGAYVAGTKYYTDNTGATEVDTTGFVEGVTDVSSYFVASTTAAKAGAMSAEDKAKLDGMNIASSADVAEVIAGLENL